MFQRRAKEKAEAAMQRSVTEDESDLCSPISECLAQKEGKTMKEWDQRVIQKTDQSGDMTDISVSQDVSDVQDIPRMDNMREEAPQPDSHKDTEFPTRASVVPFNTPDYRFECICGELGIIDYKARVQCMNCHLWQHASCVNYKEESIKTTPFYCPHCLVAMKPVSTGATLIISPSSICHQWVEEINRHIRSSSLRVLVRM